MTTTTKPTTFTELGLSPSMLKALSKKGFETPSPIQELVIREFLHNQSNLIGQAQTGTGKTAAFAIPIIETIQPNGRVKAIILTPTRELALQVSEEIYSLCGDKKIHVLAVYGGQSLDQQMRNLKRGVDIVVGTPGRVMDLMDRKSLIINELEYFVLDEADEMLNMGFVDDIELILQKTNDNKKMLFFSATMPSSILNIAKKYMGEFKTLKIQNKDMTTNLTEQIYFEVRDGNKFEALCRVLDFEQDFYGIIFCRTKLEVETTCEHLKTRGYAAGSLHGDITQVIRNKTLANFKSKTITILVATDVAARGIDVNNLTHVINYSIPHEVEAYVHRIGRTGRAGKKGIAITFVTPRESAKLSQIERITKTRITKQKVPTAVEVLSSKKEGLYAAVAEIIAENDHNGYLEMAKEITANGNAEAAVAALLRHVYQDSFLPEQYNTSLDENSYSRTYNNNNYTNNSSTVDTGDNTKLFIAIGKDDGFNPRKLLDFLKERVKTPARKVRDVKVMDKFSFITVPFDEAEIIMRKLNTSGKSLVEKAKK